MAFDGMMMSLIRRELLSSLLGARVAQVYQPARDELVFSFRTYDKTKKLLVRLSEGARVHLSVSEIENPKTPPMICMLLRKRLSGARLVAIEQPEHERILLFRFDAINEIGDREALTLAVEIMGRYSNAVLLDGNENVIDSLRRIDFSESEERVLLPKMKYELPAKQDKLYLADHSAGEITSRIIAQGADDRAALSVIQGISPIIAREIIYRAEQAQEFEKGLTEQIVLLEEIEKTGVGQPTMVYKADGSPMDTSFLSVTQYEGALPVKSYDSFSQMLDDFYIERDKRARIKAKTADLTKILKTATERLSRKINLQRADLKKCADREELRIKGDLLQANLYRVKKGESVVTVENFYDENGGELTIPLNPALSPAQNAQRYYKEYNKAKTRELKLKEQIALAGEELLYIESVQDMLSRAETEQELSGIRTELSEQGYIKANKGKRMKEKPLPPLEYTSRDGFIIWVGRNNRQNDLLTLKTANKNDIWLHTKNIPGSHVIVCSNGRAVPDTTIEEAARLAASHSKARESSQVPVDYTLVKNVSKPQGAKPGRVIYVNYKTVYVTP